MDGQPVTGSRVFRAGTRVHVVIGFFALLFGALGLFVAVQKGDWSVFGVVLVIAAVLCLLLRVLRLEVGPSGFKYRNLSSSQDVAFADIARAYFEVPESDAGPRVVAVFWVERRNGNRLKVNLRTFDIEAVAILFNALEAHGIQIEVPDEWAARRIADQVRAAQAKLRS